MRIALKPLSLAGLLVGMTACTVTLDTGGTGASTGNGGGGAGSGGGSVSIEQACADSSTASCAKRDACSNGLGSIKTFGSVALCEMRSAAVCVANLNANGTAATPDHTETCSANYATEACSAFQDGLPICGAPLPGTLDNGTACGGNGQCSSTFCALSSTEVCGTCQPLPMAGDACKATADCGVGMSCALVTAGSTGTCAPYTPAGGACLTGTTVCAATLACVGDDPTTMTMGTCTLQGATMGAACDGTRKTLPNCNDYLGLTCIPTAKGSAVGTCGNVTYVTAGMACGSIGSAPSTGFAECTGGGLCLKPTGSSMGTCVAPADDGAACDSDSTVGPPCLAPAKCVPADTSSTAGTCTMPDAPMCM